MKFLYRLLLAFESCSWMIVVFIAKNGNEIRGVPPIRFSVIAALVISGLTIATIQLSRLSYVETPITTCEECELVDGQFLPIYLGYFFVSLSVPTIPVMRLVFTIVFIFTFLAGTHIFNPLLLLFGYHFYHLRIDEETNIFLIKWGKPVKNTSAINALHVRSINNTTFIDIGKG